MDKLPNITSHNNVSTNSENLEVVLNRKFQQLISLYPTLTIDQVFYHEATRLYLEFIHKQAEIQKVQKEVQQLKGKLGIEGTIRKRHSANPNSVSVNNQNDSEKRKRSRRTAVQIARHYNCTFDKCNKSYGSQGSLNQHIKIKHMNEYTQHLLIMNLSQPSSQ